MSSSAPQRLPVAAGFDEKEFYLDEFRGHTLLFASTVSDLAREGSDEPFAAIVRALLTNDTRVIILAGVDDAARGEHGVRRLQRRLGPLIFREETLPLFQQRRARGTAFTCVEAAAAAAPQASSALLTTIWTTLRLGPLFVGIIPGADRAATMRVAQQIGTRLRVHKLILMEPQGGVTGSDGKPMSFMDETLLTTLLGAGQAEWAGLAERRPTFETVRAALLGGVASVNLCTLDGAARELFTYEGSGGTLFTLADYCKIDRLGVDDFEEVERLIERGQREGLLKQRTTEEIAAMLVNGYGATIGAHHLAGICALITEPYAGTGAGEIVGLYTMTRFKGEGVAARLLAHVLTDARAAGLTYVFACTTEERAQVFFERHDFRRVRAADVPAAKWDSYDPRRKAQVAVFRRDLS